MNFFFLTMTDIIISQNVDLSIWITLYLKVSSELVAFFLRNKSTLKMETASSFETFLPIYKGISCRNRRDYNNHQFHSKNMWEFCLLLKGKGNLRKTLRSRTLLMRQRLPVILTENLDASLNNTRTDTCKFLYKAWAICVWTVMTRDGRGIKTERDDEMTGKYQEYGGRTEWDKHMQGIRIFLDSLTLKISALHSLQLSLNVYQIIGRSQKTWILINKAMKIANVPRKKQRKKIGKRENKENWKKKKSRQVKSIDVQTSACHIPWDSQEARTVSLQYQHFVGLQSSMLTLHCN